MMFSQENKMENVNYGDSSSFAKREDNSGRVLTNDSSNNAYR